MGTPRTYQSQGIVIKHSKLGEFDRIVTVYTREFGKVRAVAKGACRPKSKLGGNVQPLTHSLLFLARGRNLDIITQSQTMNGFLAVKSDLWRLACALYILELVDSFTGEGGDNRPLFDLLVETLDQLSQAESSETPLRYFELHLLHHLGYRPQLRRCVGCDSPLKPAANSFCCAKGGVLCHDCNTEESGQQDETRAGPMTPSFPLSIEALKVLRLWQSSDYTTARRVRLRPELSRELEHTLHEYIRHILQRELKSLAWLKEVRGRTATV
jgi:DNA repair protein RecO (recombination protein O)